MADQFQRGDRVFAKIKGWPPWPAKVLGRSEGKAQAYNIKFYGTHELSTIKLDSIYPYNDANKTKYGKPKVRSGWKEAMEEIEKNIPIEDQDDDDDDEEDTSEDVSKQEQEAEGDGELMIDEGPSQPPVLIKETDEACNATSQNGKSPKPPPSPKGRRGGKASLTKKDVVPAPTPEMVRRSGRKITPKKFADDEITFTSAQTKAMTSIAEQEGSDQGKGTKRRKPAPRAKASPSPLVPPKKGRTRARIVIGKGKGAPGRASAIDRLSPDISAPVPLPTSHKFAALAISETAQRQTAKAGPQRKKQLPELSALVPGSPRAAPTTHPAAGSAPVVSPRGPAVGKQGNEVIEDEDSSEMEISPGLIEADETEAEADDKENLKGSHPASSNESDTESESEIERDSELDNASIRYLEAFDESLTRIPFSDKEGESFEIRIETKKEFETEEEEAEYEAALSNIVKFKEDLEEGEQDSHETLQELLEATKDEFESDDAIQRERRAAQMRSLRMEGEAIEIVGEIISCLGLKQTDCYRAIELLDRLGTHDLTPLILKKHPEIVWTVAKLRNYVGNVEEWDMEEDVKAEFKATTKTIRLKAEEIYPRFYALFVPPEEQNKGVPFEKIFQEEMKVFKELTQHLSENEILGLTED